MRILTLLAVTLLSFPAIASEDSVALLDLPEGHSILHVSATEQVEMEQDLLVANLRYEAENESASAVQNEVNTAMKKALETATRVESVKASTQQYYVHEHYKDRQRREFKVWRASQGLQLRGLEADELLELTGILQEEGFVLSGLSYMLSPKKREEVTDSLMEAALKKLKSRAVRAAKALGKSDAELLEINVSQHGGQIQPRFAKAARMEVASMAMDSVATPSAAPGESTISLTVSANALIKP